MTELDRRTALRCAAIAGLGTPLLAACGGGDESGGGGAAGSSSSSTSPSAAKGEVFAKAGDIPVGSGTIFPDQQVVVTQPTQGEFKGFDFRCTHRKCPVTKIESKQIECTCHGSRFSITDGSPEQGPADQPLAAVQLKVDGDQISLA